MIYCLALGFVCFLTLNIVSIVQDRRQGHKKPRPPITTKPVQYRLITKAIESDNSHQELIKQYPVLLTYINNGYIIDSINPLELRHKDRPHD